MQQILHTSNFYTNLYKSKYFLSAVDFLFNYRKYSGDYECRRIVLMKI